ncbi:dihydrodipicolinate synthase family protein [Herbaspirillum sp. RV1423]|uniref:dihydrodipicolinate synthase family protein n=1 Tax=Herbaspirillum sp. RV1423 TaxID=1443993 RepID=UPI0004AF3320|nr:dihydrodipicolinate synthase family protein [Herbaspirillum sp. RV1423]
MNSAGLLVPPLTPFGDDLQVDYPALQRGVDYVVQRCRPEMVVAAGVEVQEYHYLTLEQRKELIRHTIEFVDGRVPTAVGISHPSFKVAVELAHYAQKLGAQAVQLLVPSRPFGGESTQSEQLAYFEAVSREIGLPIVLYINAGPGADVSVDATIELARLDRVKYVKESSRDLSRVSRLIMEIDRAGLARYYTTMQMLLITLQLGGSGGTLPPPAAELGCKLIEAWQAGDLAEATRLQAQFALFPARWMRHGLLPVSKAALKAVGVDAGNPYPPFKPLQGRDLEEMTACLHATDLFSKET